MKRIAPFLLLAAVASASTNFACRQKQAAPAADTAAAAASPLTQSATPGKSPWADTWKLQNTDSADTEMGAEYVSLSIDVPSATELAISFDNGSGPNRFSASGRGVITSPTSATATMSHQEGAPCSVALELSKKQLTVSSATDCYGTGVWVSSDTALTYRAGFDCGKATSAVEKRICSTRALASLDVAVTGLYAKLTSSLDPAAIETLRAEQRSWLRARDTECTPLAERTQLNCLERHYGARHFVLHAWEAYGLHLTGAVDFAAVSAVATKAEANDTTIFEELGLAAWLESYVNVGLLDDEIAGSTFRTTDEQVVLEGRTHRPMGSGRDRELIFVFAAGEAMWFAIEEWPDLVVHAQPNNTIAAAPSPVTEWAAAREREACVERPATLRMTCPVPVRLKNTLPGPPSR